MPEQPVPLLRLRFSLFQCIGNQPDVLLLLFFMSYGLRYSTSTNFMKSATSQLYGTVGLSLEIQIWGKSVFRGF